MDKSFKEIADITFKKHEKTFEKLAMTNKTTTEKIDNIELNMRAVDLADIESLSEKERIELEMEIVALAWNYFQFKLKSISEEVKGLKQHDRDGYNSYWNNALVESINIINKHTE